MFWYFQPTSCDNRPTVVYSRPGFSLKTRIAAGTTILRCELKGSGHPSKTFKRCRAAAPRAVLCGSMPRTTRQKIRAGARKWKAPRRGFVTTFLRKKSKYFSLARKKVPEMFKASARVTTTFCPLNNCLATIEAKRPNK